MTKDALIATSGDMVCIKLAACLEFNLLPDARLSNPIRCCSNCTAFHVDAVYWSLQRADSFPLMDTEFDLVEVPK